MSVELWWALILRVLVSVAGSLGVEAPEVTLFTSEGQSLRGTLVPGGEQQFGWSSADFLEPLLIRPERVDRIEFANDAQGLSEHGDSLEFLLLDGSRLRGELVRAEAPEWEIDARGLGRITVATSELLGAEPLEGGAFVYRGPAGLSGWLQGSKRERWTMEPGRLLSSAAKSELARDFGWDGERRIELRLAYGGEPHFRVTLGARSRKGLGKGKVVVEPWGASLVAWRESDAGLEMVELLRELPADSELHLIVRTGVDGFVFTGGDGLELGRLSLLGVPGGWLILTDDGGDLSLEELLVNEVTPDAEPPRRLAADELEGMDPEGAYLVGGESFPSARLAGIDFPGASEQREAPEGHLRLTYLDGRLIHGEFLELVPGGVRLQPDWHSEPLLCSWSGLRDVAVIGGAPAFKRRRSSKSFLMTGGGEFAGELEAIEGNGDIRWAPTITEQSGTVSAEAVERVVINRTTAYFVSSRKFPHLLRLRDGDSFRCKVLELDGETLRFASPFGGERELDVARIKALEVDPRSMERFAELLVEVEQDTNWWNAPDPRRETSEGLDADSLKRALALPRKYKERRFEHLVVARNGDFLRAGLTGWSEDGVTYPGPGGTERRIGLDVLAAIVWLDSNSDEEPGEVPARVVLDDQTRLSVSLSGAGEGRLTGDSGVLGALDLDLSHVISIELGEGAQAGGTAYDEWVLKPMKEPFPDDGSAATAGGSSPLIGQPALASAGVDMNGVDFSLADYKGKVVLLDFWGHW